VNTLFGELAGDVPQRDLNAAERAHEVRAAMIEGLIVGAAHEALEIAGVLADEVAGQFLHQRLSAVELSLDRKLAEAFEASGGQDPQQAPTGRHLKCFDSFDAQRLAHVVPCTLAYGT